MANKPSLEALRANFGQLDNKQDNDSRPNNYFPFWNMPFDESCEVRFLPDLNEENPLQFIVEKFQHNLTVNGKRRRVPCMNMYDEECPVCAVSQDYYRADDKVNGGKYWKKRQYIAQVVVMKSSIPLREGEEDPVGKVKLLAINPTLFKIIKDAFDSGELEEVPYDFKNGTNFIIKKTKQGEYADYSLSKFARKESALPDEIIESLDAGMVDLSTVLPRNIGRDKVEALLEADLNGTEYKDDDDDNSGSSAPAASNTPAPKEESAPAPAPQEEAAAAEDEGEDILAKIRARRAQRQAED